MGKFGRRKVLAPIGLLTAMVSGVMPTTTAGPGLATNPGVGRHITMDAGFTTRASVGAGGLAQRSVSVFTGVRHSWASSVSAVDSVGSRWRLSSSFTRGGVMAAGLMRRSAVATNYNISAMQAFAVAL